MNRGYWHWHCVCVCAERLRSWEERGHDEMAHEAAMIVPNNVDRKHNQMPVIYVVSSDASTISNIRSVTVCISS